MMLKILRWNVRGTVRATVLARIKEMVLAHAMNILIMMEIKCRRNRSDKTISSLKNIFSVCRADVWNRIGGGNMGILGSWCGNPDSYSHYGPTLVVFGSTYLYKHQYLFPLCSVCFPRQDSKTNTVGIFKAFCFVPRYPIRPLAAYARFQ